MWFDMTYTEALKKADALKELGEIRVVLARTDTPAWDVITRVEIRSSGWRGVPSSMYVVAEVSGLTLLWNIEFEPRDANGSGRHQWNIPYLRDIVAKMRPEARLSFAGVISDKVLPEMMKRTNEYREYLRIQEASELGARSLLAFCSSK